MKVRTNVFVDFNWCLYRYFYVFESLSVVSQGKTVQTGTLYGFVSLVRALRRRFPNCHIHFCLDTGVPVKIKQFPFYKANRTERPTVHSLDDAIFGFLSGLKNVSIIQAPGYEADDVMATGVRALQADPFWPAPPEGELVILPDIEAQRQSVTYVYSGDDDMLQLLQYPNVRVVRKLSTTDFEELDSAYVMENYGVLPKDLLLYRSLIGDASDNIPPVVTRFPRNVAKHIASSYKEPDDINRDQNVFLGDKHRLLADPEVFAKWVANYKLMTLCTVPLERVTFPFRGFQAYIDDYSITSIRELSEARDLALPAFVSMGM